jgi:hypothetical protein
MPRSFHCILGSPASSFVTSFLQFIYPPLTIVSTVRGKVNDMKLKHIVSLGTIGLTASIVLAQSQVHGLVVHEWGTFTSFQGSDGNLLEWKPLETSQLPKFVYDWTHPGLGRLSADMAVRFGKGLVPGSLQRMETPVIYFYSDKEQSVDVSVDFPDGSITEWFPQAGQIGPSILLSNRPAYMPTNAAAPVSMIHWPSVRVMPAETSRRANSALRNDNSGSHYFTARETDASMLEVNAPDPKMDYAEFEKFLFYRGVAHFATPLRVVMKSDDAVNIANTGNQPLAHLFVLDIKGDSGRFVYVPELAPGAVKIVLLNLPDQAHSVDELSTNISSQMVSALTATGLYPREATAMVKTWKDSWFKEQGVRVLYVLPRAWTDRTLPMTLNPAPREVVRTMVGRAEVMSPGVEHDLAAQLEKMSHGDAQATAEARRILKELGRFAEPALNRVIDTISPKPEERGRLLALLNPSTKFE